MAKRILADAFVEELHTEYTSSKRCLERIPETLYEYKPHPASMNFGYLSLLVAEIPLWIRLAIENGEVDFSTYNNFTLSTTEKLLRHFKESFKGAIDALKNINDEDMEKPFVLRNGEKALMKQTIRECVGSSINHWVHHRGQLTVYMRMNNIAVPSIYGPSADEKVF